MVAKKAATSSAEKHVVVPAPNLQEMAVRIVGRTPLLTNRFSEGAIEQIEKSQQHEPKGPREARDPHADFNAACHVISPGVYGFPSAGIKKAIVAAGGRFADEKMTHLRGIINIPQALIAIEAPEPKMRKDPARLKMGNGFTLAYRPEFNPWAMMVPVVYNASIISPGQVLNLFQIAGFAVGIGSWRPESNGAFGQFTIEDLGAVMAA